MKEERKWLQECLEAYNNLLYICGEKSFGIEDSTHYFDFRHNIDESFIKNLFPIFKHIKTSSEFTFQQGGLVEDSIQKELHLCIRFDSKHKESVANWFIDSIFEQFLLNKIDNTTWIIEFTVKDIIKDIINNEIRELKKDCEQKAQPFYDNLENQLLSDYEEQCLEEDEYYLGVRFISYDGEWPTYCFGNICLEIEGIPYEFRLHDLQKNDYDYDINSIKPEVFDENIRRYYHEIMRLIKKHLRSTCCGGCE